MCFREASAPLSSFSSSQVPAATSPGSPPSPSPANPQQVWTGTSALPAQRGDHGTASHARSILHRKSCHCAAGRGWGGREEEQQPQQKPTLSFHKTAEFISLQPFTSVSSYKMKEALKKRGDEIKPSVLGSWHPCHCHCHHGRNNDRDCLCICVCARVHGEEEEEDAHPHHHQHDRLPCGPALQPDSCPLRVSRPGTHELSQWGHWW